MTSSSLEFARNSVSIIGTIAEMRGTESARLLTVVSRVRVSHAGVSRTETAELPITVMDPAPLSAIASAGKGSTVLIEGRIRTYGDRSFDIYATLIQKL